MNGSQSKKKRKRAMRDARTPPASPDSSWAAWIVCLTLASASIAAYANSFSAPFIFDDRVSILENPGIRRLWPPGPALWPAAQTATSGRPLASFSFALNYALDEYRVWGYHATNLVLHLLNALLVFAIGRRTLTSEENRIGGASQAGWLAGAAALIWTVHPLLSESVTYIMQRTELLMALFLLLTIYSLRRAAESPGSFRWPAMAVLSSALGMCCKEVMAAAPLLAILYDRCFISPSFKEIFKRRGGLYAALFSTWLILAALIAAGPRTLSVGVRFTNLTPFEYLLTQAGVILHYLLLSVFPYPLSIDYSDWPIARNLVPVLPQAIAVVALLLLSAWALKSRPRLGFLGAWFFLILAPSSSLIPIVTEPAAERRMYLPLLSVVFLVVIGAHRLAASSLREAYLRRVEAGVAVLLTVALIWMTATRNEAYRTEETIWADVVAKRPRDARALNNLGSAQAREGRSDDAMPLFIKALEINPNYPEAHNNLGGALYNQRRMDEAIEHFSEAVRLKPDYAAAHLNLGLALHNRGRLDEAIAQYLEVLRLKPDDAEAHNHLGAALRSQGRLQEAVDRFKEALRLRPGYPEAQRNLDSALSAR
jgi:tetratricopeptide (TPR) repeat protein